MSFRSLTRIVRMAVAMPVWVIGLAVMATGTALVLLAGWVINDTKEVPK